VFRIAPVSKKFWLRVGLWRKVVIITIFHGDMENRDATKKMLGLVSQDLEHAFVALFFGK
jgi:hypothetical protein